MYIWPKKIPLASQTALRVQKNPIGIDLCAQATLLAMDTLPSYMLMGDPFMREKKLITGSRGRASWTRGGGACETQVLGQGPQERDVFGDWRPSGEEQKTVPRGSRDRLSSI